MPFFNSTYSLRKARYILRAAYGYYQKKWKTMLPQELDFFETELDALDQAILSKNRKDADLIARRVEKFTHSRLKRSFGNYLFELCFALVFALVIATLIRQVWFEPYEIPTGSMRPTFEEQDRLIVKKTTFGINYPLKTDHLYFDPNLVQRAGIVIFSGDNIDLSDTDSTYFWVFPYKKRYVKRCMGRPGDTLYFYGGQIYGMDVKGNDLVELRDNPSLTNLEYIPFLNFEGRMSINSSFDMPLQSQIYFKQMNIPIGRLVPDKMGQLRGEIFDGKNWVKDQPNQNIDSLNGLKTYGDFWGMRNFAMARLLTEEQLKKLTDVAIDRIEKGILYLEIHHQPNLTFPSPTVYSENSHGFKIFLNPSVSVLPLQEHHLQKLMNNMYTARFVVQNGYATRYNYTAPFFTNSSPAFQGIPDGTYEFYYGKAYKILWGGIPSELPKDHPLYSLEPQNIQNLYNLGIELSSFHSPEFSRLSPFFPSRFAYFREGNLFLLGAPVFKRDDPLLLSFLERENQRQQQSKTEKPYVAFRDFGPPLKEGKLDKQFLETFGLKIPEKHYLCLGDNHAMSADSRYFGFVPQENLQGSPVLKIWPPNRFGIPNQKPYPWFTFPNIIIWGLALAIGSIFLGIDLYKKNKPIFKKLS